MRGLLGTGEFSLADKIQPADYILNRTDVLKRLYASDPELARQVISAVYPHDMKRHWEHSEIQERLGIAPVAKQAFLTKAAVEFFANQFPSLSAALDAYQASRERQMQIDAANQAAAFPALHATQPMMSPYQSMMPSQPAPVHHRRHYHRHHSG